jgi:hypothetical protein
VTFSPAAATSKAISQVGDPAPKLAYAFVYLVEFYIRHTTRALRPEAECSINGPAGQENTQAREASLLSGGDTLTVDASPLF